LSTGYCASPGATFFPHAAKKQNIGAIQNDFFFTANPAP
jgi:hypothetical protein